MNRFFNAFLFSLFFCLNKSALANRFPSSIAALEYKTKKKHVTFSAIKMTVESSLDIVERKNEENLKLSTQMSDTMKKLILNENEPIAPIAPTIADADLESTHANNAPSTQTDLQRFYACKNVFITGGTGK